MNNKKIINAFFLQDDAKIESVEKALSSSVVSPDDLKTITEEIDQIKQHPSVSDHQEKLTSLYGRLETLEVNNEVDKLFEESLDLQSDEAKLEEKVAKKRALEEKIQTLQEHHALTAENRRYIEIALKKLRNQKGATPALAASKNHSQDKNLDGSIPLILCEAAYALYNNHLQEAERILNQLTPWQQERLQEHALAMGAKKLATISDSDLAAQRSNLICLIRAVLGYASELAQDDEGHFFYPSQEEVDLMFSEVDHL